MLDFISSAVSTTCKIVVLKVIKNVTPCSSLVAANVNDIVNERVSKYICSFCLLFGRTHPYALIPSKGLPSRVRASKGRRV